jgi:hypothetical protein
MNDIQMLALSKVKFDRDNIPVGDHSVEFTVKVKGTVKVGNDYERDATTSIPWLESVALWQETASAAFDSLISRMDKGETITRADLVAMRKTGPLATGVLVDCIRTALVTGDSAVGSILDRVTEVKEGVEKVKMELVKQLPKQSCKGATKVICDWQIV